MRCGAENERVRARGGATVSERTRKRENTVALLGARERLQGYVREDIKQDIMDANKRANVCMCAWDSVFVYVCVGAGGARVRTSVPRVRLP